MDRNNTNWTGFKDVECVIISMEDHSIINYDKLDKFRKIDNCYFFILLRSPYCHFSSIWKAYDKSETRLLEIIKLWKIYAKHFINDNNSEFIKVLYDELSTNDNYIFNIMRKIGIDNINIDKDKYILYQRSSFPDPVYIKTSI